MSYKTLQNLVAMSLTNTCILPDHSILLPNALTSVLTSCSCLFFGFCPPRFLSGHFFYVIALLALMKHSLWSTLTSFSLNNLVFIAFHAIRPSCLLYSIIDFLNYVFRYDISSRRQDNFLCVSPLESPVSKMRIGSEQICKYFYMEKMDEPIYESIICVS